MADLWELGYLGLALASFLAATVVPFSSEVVLTALLLLGYEPVACVAVASASNTLGGMTTYYLGRLGKWSWLGRWFGLPADRLERMRQRVDRYGSWAATLTWTPVSGDLIAAALGLARAGALRVLFWMLIGKLARYVAVTVVVVRGMGA